MNVLMRATRAITRPAAMVQQRGFASTVDQYSAHIAKYDAAAKAVADHNNSKSRVSMPLRWEFALKLCS